MAVCDVAADRFSADHAGGADVVGAGPELVLAGFIGKSRECLPCHLRAISFEQSHDLCGRAISCRLGIHQDLFHSSRISGWDRGIQYCPDEFKDDLSEVPAAQDIVLN